MQSNADLVNYLKQSGVLYDEDVERAMRAVDRRLFVPAERARAAYEDTPIPTSQGQTISAPHMVAIMTQHLAPAMGMNILEIGCGSGYQAAILSEIVGEFGHITAIERVPELARASRQRLSGYDNITVLHGDGSKGYPKKAPFDRIVVSCAATKAPRALLGQLSDAGRMLVPINHGPAQDLTLFQKVAGQIESQDLNCKCQFVPLVE